MDEKIKADSTSLYPKDYVTPEPANPGDEEAEYIKCAENLRVRIKALVKTAPVLREVIIRELAKQAAPGTTAHWGRAIDDVDREWHPEKYAPEGEVEVIKEK